MPLVHLEGDIQQLGTQENSESDTHLKGEREKTKRENRVRSQKAESHSHHAGYSSHAMIVSQRVSLLSDDIDEFRFE